MSQLAAGAEAGVEPVVTAEELCERYASQVCRFAAMVATSDQDAEDIAQEALLRSIRSLGRFDSAAGTMEGWLFRIVVNASRDAGRSEGRRLALLRRLQEWQPSSRQISPESLALDQLRDSELLTAVRRLRPRARTAVALRYGADLPYEAVGAALGISGEAARKVSSRALDELRQLLGGTRP